jgi:hypothetical protein
MRKRNFSSGISETLKTERAVALTYEKGCLRDICISAPSLRRRSLNDVNLLSFGSAQLIIVARLIAWRGVRAKASRFGVFRKHRHFRRKVMLFLLWGGGDMGISLFSFTITVSLLTFIVGIHWVFFVVLRHVNGLPRWWGGRVDVVDRAR